MILLFVLNCQALHYSHQVLQTVFRVISCNIIANQLMNQDGPRRLQMSSGSIYKGKKLKNLQNQDLNIWDVVTCQEVSQLGKFFHQHEGLFGRATCLKVNRNLLLVGTENSHVICFDNVSITWVGTLAPKQRGAVLQIESSPDDYHVFIAYKSNTISFSNVQTFRERLAITHPRPIKKIVSVPITATQSYLSTFSIQGYFELIVLDDNSTITRYSFEIDQTHNHIRTEEASIYKFGLACLTAKSKNDKPAKVADPSFTVQAPIVDISIMDEAFVEDIQYVEEESDYSSERRSTQEPDLVRKESFLDRLLGRSSYIEKHYHSSQYVFAFYITEILMTVLFHRKVEVVRLWFGKGLEADQQRIEVALKFERPDSFVYELVQQRQSLTGTRESSCTWGVGSFKETNKRYVLMLVNWDGKEFYAFKCMRNETNIQVVQGGHFYLTEETGKGIQFISNSIFVSLNSKSELLFMTTLQFEYGVPFSLADIAKHVEQEKQIKSMSQGQYSPTFSSYQNGESIVEISHGVMESITDGYQRGLPIEFTTRRGASISYNIFEDNCYILCGSCLHIIKLKNWNEYLEDLSCNGEWAKTFADAMSILEGQFTLLGGLPENDVERFETTREFFCKLTFTFLILALKEELSKEEVNQSLLMVMKFLFRTRNEDYLFTVIEDMFIGAGKQENFYTQLCETLSELHSADIKFHIRRDSVLRVFKQLSVLGRSDIVQMIVFSFQEIDFDAKPVVDFLLECDMIAEMVHVCTQMNDYLTPYLRIVTIFQVKSNYPEDDITQLTVAQLGKHALEYIQLCLSGQYFYRNKNLMFTERQFKFMLKDIFEYLFDLQNLSLFLKLDFKKALEVLLLAFQQRVQDSLKSLHDDGKQINIRVPKDVMNGLWGEILAQGDQNNHLDSLRRIYVLIRQSELSYLSSIDSPVGFYDVSVAFTTHVVSHARLGFTFQHVALAINRYISILRDGSPIFDISWVLRGKVQKKLDEEVMKNEFLWQLTEGLNGLLSHKTKQDMQYLRDLLQKSVQTKWIWMQCWCLIQLDHMEESLRLLLAEPNPQLSEKIFNILIEELRCRSHPFVVEWVLNNMAALASENSQKLFSLLYTFMRRDLASVAAKMMLLPQQELDAKHEHKSDEHISLAFFRFLNARGQSTQWDQQLQMLQQEALKMYAINNQK